MKCNIENCKSEQSKEWKCSKCNLLFCTLICLSKHITTIHNSTCSSHQSPFLVKGTYLPTPSNHEAYFDFKNFEFIFNSNRQLKCIGSGAFGDLYLAKNKIDRKFFAIKQVNKAKVLETGATLAIIKREIGIHLRLIHPHIVRLFSQHEDNSNYYMIMEHVQNGTLFQEIQRYKGLTEELAFKYFIQVASAIHFLHQNGLAHRDIKPENILIDIDGNAKLCDFGWCADISQGERATFCGTYEYMAPEIVNDQLYDYSTDIWSLGVLLYEMLHGYSPFRAVINKDAMTEIFRNIKERKYTIDKKISEECGEIISRLLTSDTKKRMKINEIFEHHWVIQKEKKSSVVNNNDNNSMNSTVDASIISTITNKKPIQNSNNTMNENILNVPLNATNKKKEIINENKSLNMSNDAKNSFKKPAIIADDNIILKPNKKVSIKDDNNINLMTANKLQKPVIVNNFSLSTNLIDGNNAIPSIHNNDSQKQIVNELKESKPVKEVKEFSSKFKSNNKSKVYEKSRDDKDDFDDIIGLVHKANKSKPAKKEKKKTEKKTNNPSFNVFGDHNKSNIIILDNTDQMESFHYPPAASKSMINEDSPKDRKKNKKKNINIDDLEISESDEFAFLKDIPKYQNTKKTYDPSKVLNMNFLPKDILYKESCYKESTQEILATIDLLDKAQRQKQGLNDEINDYSTKSKKNENIFEKFFKNFQCGQCSSMN